MKKIIAVAALATISTSAFAFDYKIGLEGRADFISSTSKTEIGATTAETKFNGFQSGLIRLSLSGNINENLAYKFRYRFNTNYTQSANTRDKSTNAVDHLYVDHKNSIFTTRFGKTNWAEAYGRESFISSTDLLILSDAYTAYNNNLGTYRFGVSGTYTFAETNKITLAISNPNADLTDTTAASATNEKKNTSLAYAAHYSSVLFNKMFQPTLSYTTAKQDNDVKSAKNTMMAAGFRTEVVGLIVDADWKQFKQEAQTNGGVDTKTSSIFSNIAYNINEWSPFVQYINDKVKGAAASEYKKNSIAGGVMWKPFADTNFRYHLAYTNTTKKFDVAANGKVKDNIITFGIKADL